jgi:hypothetical protein
MSSATETTQTNWVEELLRMSPEMLARLDSKLVIGVNIIRHALAGEKAQAIDLYADHFDRDLMDHLRVLLEGLRSELDITNYLRELPENERKALKNQKLATAIEACQFALQKQDQKVHEILNQTEGPEARYYFGLLVEGKYPTRLRDLVELSDEDLAAVYNLPAPLFKGVGIVKHWLNYEKDIVLEKCDSLVTLCAVRDILRDTVPDAVQEFNELTAAKWKIFLSDANQLADLWGFGLREDVFDACNNKEIAPSLLSLLQQAVTAAIQAKSPEAAEEFKKYLQENQA